METSTGEARKTVGQSLFKRRMKEKGFSFANLEVATGIDRGDLSNYSNGKRKCGPKRARLIAKELGGHWSDYCTAGAGDE